MSDNTQQTRLPELQFTQVPNLYFELMPVMSEPEMKVMGAAIRNIIGYHKTAPEPMAQSWFIKKTGLSRNAVKKGIIEAVDRGWLAVATDPTKFTSTEYVLVFEGGEVSQNDPRKEDRGSNRDPHEMTPQKKEVLKKEEDKSSALQTEVNKGSIAIIQVWLEENSAIVEGAYGNTGYRHHAKKLTEAGYTSDDVQAFIRHCKAEKFWQGRAVGWKHISENIGAWKAAGNPDAVSQNDTLPTYTPELAAEQARIKQETEDIHRQWVANMLGEGS